MLLKEEVKKDFYYKVDCFVLVIMIYGILGVIYGVDGKIVFIEEIKMMLNGENFFVMVDKFKVFFI